MELRLTFETSAPHRSGQRKRRQRDDPYSRGPRQRGQAATTAAGRRRAAPTTDPEAEELPAGRANLQ